MQIMQRDPVDKGQRRIQARFQRQDSAQADKRPDSQQEPAQVFRD